ncbi:putative branched-chain amino acid transport system ATP-binding protein [Pseudooceanicola batsensis HTCC2597]|uniref:Putative branched-chain amino acid transport system ATP-binding protein n=1 Tax=Pseudooceanicola batsensis (strain ATCC BAA-863 / DSM 15984 / KCTC 12145 / HTCC2597) TaxID=252305 RepID=A3U139_PSEBH|nr:ABC transporter ATP-binding protein [Pseudooceanicola batsensis]EAQ02022.1 putative branched-chain amino acid transport system ATP-binding protein [Pseudooceanicola batsensis HTCC2597]
MSAFLEAKDLDAFYGQVQALHGLSLSMERGTITTLLGANGAGKTTTLRAICNMIRTSGTISLNGQRISGRSTERIVEMGVAHVPQGRGTFTTLSVDENLRLGAMTRTDHRGIEDDIEKMFARFPILKKRRSQQAGTLSGGEQQMLAVARALMLRPQLMLLDEPSFGLAPLVVQELFEILGQVNRDDGVSILVVEQNAQLALKIATKAYVIASGRIAMSGAAEEIAQDDEVRKSYLGY